MEENKTNDNAYPLALQQSIENKNGQICIFHLPGNYSYVDILEKHQNQLIRKGLKVQLTYNDTISTNTIFKKRCKMSKLGFFFCKQPTIKVFSFPWKIAVLWLPPFKSSSTLFSSQVVYHAFIPSFNALLPRTLFPYCVHSHWFACFRGRRAPSLCSLAHTLKHHHRIDPKACSFVGKRRTGETGYMNLLLLVSCEKPNLHTSTYTDFLWSK